MKELNINIKIDEMGYTKEEQDYLLGAMGFMALIGAPCEIKTDEDLKNWCDEKLANKKRAEEEKEEKKRRKEEREKAKADAEGLTVEEWKKEQSRKRSITRVKNEIAKLEKELKYKKKYLEKLENRG